MPGPTAFRSNVGSNDGYVNPAGGIDATNARLYSGHFAGAMHGAYGRIPLGATIERGSTIISATLSGHGGDTIANDATVDFRFALEANPTTVASHTDFNGRPRTTAATRVTGRSTVGVNADIDVTAALQELVDSYSVDTVLWLSDPISPTSSGAYHGWAWTSAEHGVNFSPWLTVEWEAPPEGVINAVGIESEEAFGTPSVILHHQYVQPAGIPSAAAFGTPVVAVEQIIDLTVAGKVTVGATQAEDQLVTGWVRWNDGGRAGGAFAYAEGNPVPDVLSLPITLGETADIELIGLDAAMAANGDVRLDGGAWQPLENHNGREAWGIVALFQGVAAGPHTVQVRRTGVNPGVPAGAWLHVDEVRARVPFHGGIPSSTAFGSPSLTTLTRVFPQGIPSAMAFGRPSFGGPVQDAPVVRSHVNPPISLAASRRSAMDRVEASVLEGSAHRRDREPR